MKITIDDLMAYLIDSQGYAKEDLENKDKQTLFNMVDDVNQLMGFTFGEFII